MKESAGLSQTQQDSSESAQYHRISKIPPNRKDSSNPADSSKLLDSSNPTDSRPRLSTNEPSSLHSLPQLEGLSLVAGLIVKRLFGLLRVRGLVIARAQSPFLVIVV